MESRQNEPTDQELISNFNKIQLRCIGCGAELTSDARVRQKQKEDTMVCKEYHDAIQSDYGPESSRFVITCLICDKCGQKFCIAAFDHGK